MWLEVPTHLQSIKPPELDNPVDLSAGETVQVKKEVGTVLTEKYDNINQS